MSDPIAIRLIKQLGELQFPICQLMLKEGVHQKVVKWQQKFAEEFYDGDFKPIGFAICMLGTKRCSYMRVPFGDDVDDWTYEENLAHIFETREEACKMVADLPSWSFRTSVVVPVSKFYIWPTTMGY